MEDFFSTADKKRPENSKTKRLMEIVEMRALR